MIIKLNESTKKKKIPRTSRIVRYPFAS